MPRTIFEKIADDEIPGYKLFQGFGFMVILDIHPATPGHAMTIPLSPDRTWLDATPKTHLKGSAINWLVGQRQREVLGVSTVTTAVFGEEVPHLHYHAMPSYERGDTITRMNPNSGRMQEPVDHLALNAMREILAFPDDLVQQAGYELKQIDNVIDWT